MWHVRLKKTVIVLAAVIGYGGWAVYSNLMDGSAAAKVIAWRAGCIQGSYAGGLTFINIWILESLYQYFVIRYQALSALLLTLTATTLAQYSVIIPVHAYNETPNILITLLPGLIIGTTFSLIYLLEIKKQYRQTK